MISEKMIEDVRGVMDIVHGAEKLVLLWIMSINIMSRRYKKILFVIAKRRIIHGRK